MTTAHPETAAIRAILALVARHAGLKVADLVGPRKNREISAARALAAALCFDLVRGATTTTIGHAFGGRSHSFVVRAAQRWNKTGRYAGMRLLAQRLEEGKRL